jgi:hypothetical protein
MHDVLKHRHRYDDVELAEVVGWFGAYITPVKCDLRARQVCPLRIVDDVEACVCTPACVGKDLPELPAATANFEDSSSGQVESASDSGSSPIGLLL